LFQRIELQIVSFVYKSKKELYVKVYCSVHISPQSELYHEFLNIFLFINHRELYHTIHPFNVFNPFVYKSQNMFVSQR